MIVAKIQFYELRCVLRQIMRGYKDCFVSADKFGSTNSKSTEEIDYHLGGLGFGCGDCHESKSHNISLKTESGESSCCLRKLP